MNQGIKFAAEEMLSKTAMTYTIHEVIKFQRQQFKNLPELLGQYPNKGIGFKIWRKTWPNDKYIIVKETEYKNLRNGKIYGIEYFKGRPQSPQPIKVRNGSKRGVWRYDVNGSSGLTDNGVYYSTEELTTYMKLHQFQQKTESENEKNNNKQ